MVAEQESRKIALMGKNVIYWGSEFILDIAWKNPDKQGHVCWGLWW